ncbi:MAG: VWA domain-containing protein, partial [Deltaproteobacteria bacterium]|nr:VWA domain-containing protein [Deltaproteobacteria bacterium]
MSFLNPGMLITLGLIPILILIHTLKPKPRQVEVSNLFLWQAVLKERSRDLSFERLKRNLPLMLQILLVILAALALANPTWEYSVSRSGNLILVVDTSASMKTNTASGTRFERAIEKALDLIEQRGNDQKILIVEAAKKPLVKVGFSDDTRQAMRMIKSLTPTDQSAELKPAIYLALSFVDASRRDSIYVITDGAGGDLSGLVKRHPMIKPVIVSGGQNNIGIIRFEFRQAFAGYDQYEIMLEVKNFTPAAVECPVRLSIDNTVLFEDPIFLRALEKKVLIIPYSGLITGIARAHLSIDDDFSIDNQAYLSLNASKDVWVLLVSEGNYFLEKLLGAYPNFKVNAVKEIIPSSWQEQVLRHDIVIVDRMDFPETQKGNFLLINAYSPSIPLVKTGEILFPRNIHWDHGNPIMANVDFGGMVVEQATLLQAGKQAVPVVESADTGLLYTYENDGLRAAIMGFDITRSDLPFKIAFPVMMSNIVNWLNPHKLEFSALQARAGRPFEIFLDP